MVSEMDAINQGFTHAGIKKIKRENSSGNVMVSVHRDRLYRFMKNKGAVFGMFFIVITIIMALFGPSMNEFVYDKVEILNQNKAPDSIHWFGTDNLGRDLWTRTFMGTRISLYVAVLAVIIDISIGIVIGVICGYYGGAVDMIIQRILEIIQGIPTVIVVTLLMIVLKPGLKTITFALCFAGWINMSKLVRAQVLRLKESEFVFAAKTMGENDFKIIFREILPNAIGQVIIMAMMSVPEAIFLEAYLSFLGLGIPDPMASLGSLINNGFNYMLLYPYMVAIPVVLFVILMISFNLVADGLRDAFDASLNGK